MRAVRECTSFSKVLTSFCSILRSICASKGGITFQLSSKEEISWMIKSFNNICKNTEKCFLQKKKLLKIENFNFFVKYEESRESYNNSSIFINTSFDPQVVYNNNFKKHILSKQILLFLQVQVKAGNLVNDTFHSIFSQDSDKMLIVNITDLLRTMNNSLLGQEVIFFISYKKIQAVYGIMKEELIIDSFMILLDTKSYEEYLLMISEISLICELFTKCKFIRKSLFKIQCLCMKMGH